MNYSAIQMCFFVRQTVETMWRSERNWSILIHGWFVTSHLGMPMYLVIGSSSAEIQRWMEWFYRFDWMKRRRRLERTWHISRVDWGGHPDTKWPWSMIYVRTTVVPTNSLFYRIPSDHSSGHSTSTGRYHQWTRTSVQCYPQSIDHRWSSIGDECRASTIGSWDTTSRIHVRFVGRRIGNDHLATRFD